MSIASEVPQPQPKREPDMHGRSGRAWVIRHPLQSADQKGTVRAYLVHAPHGHPFWPWYCVHLRDIPGVPSAHKQFTEATHEYIFAAIDPATYAKTDPDEWLGGAQHLHPLDLIHQVANLTDEQATGVLDAVVRAVINGSSPDQDYRASWKHSIDATADHFRAGVHRAGS